MGLRILIVDDEKAVRTALGRLLATRKEWQVVGEAADGAEAIGMARELQPDIVIMDITMPEMNGLDATPEIKKALPGCRSADLHAARFDANGSASPECRRERLSAEIAGQLAGDGCGSDGPAQAIFSGQESAAARVGLAMRTFLFLIEASFAHRRSPGAR